MSSVSRDLSQQFIQRVLDEINADNALMQICAIQTEIKKQKDTNLYIVKVIDIGEKLQEGQQQIKKDTQQIKEGVATLISSQKKYSNNNLSTALTTIPASGFVIGREDDIQNVGDLLKNEKIVYIYADGGVGKTALASEIINRVKNQIDRNFDKHTQFKHVAWITSSGDLKSDLTALNIPAVKFAASVDDKFQAVSNFLQRNSVLLVIDNMDTPPTTKERDILNTISGKTRILITTRANIHIGHQYDLKLLDKDASLILFYKHMLRKELSLEQIKSREDFDYTSDIVEAAECNSLLVELIAKLSYKEHKNLGELWKQLQKDVFNISSLTGIDSQHGSRRYGDTKLTIEEQVRRLYEMSGLTEAQQDIMTFISVFPAGRPIFFDAFKWAGFEDKGADDINYLQDRGWIERTEDGYQVHPMIRGSVRKQNKHEGKVFDIWKYESLIEKLIDTDQYMPRTLEYTKVKERIVVPEAICEILDSVCSIRAHYNHAASSVSKNSIK